MVFCDWLKILRPACSANSWRCVHRVYSQAKCGHKSQGNAVTHSDLLWSKTTREILSVLEHFRYFHAHSIHGTAWYVFTHGHWFMVWRGNIKDVCLFVCVMGWSSSHSPKNHIYIFVLFCFFVCWGLMFTPYKMITNFTLPSKANWLIQGHDFCVVRNNFF
jgi:hypothetical protein